MFHCPPPLPVLFPPCPSCPTVVRCHNLFELQRILTDVRPVFEKHVNVRVNLCVPTMAFLGGNVGKFGVDDVFADVVDEVFETFVREGRFLNLGQLDL